VDKLREEVEILRSELHRAEVELEDRCWVAPTILQVKSCTGQRWSWRTGAG
jgi:hypothetical protein